MPYQVQNFQNWGLLAVKFRKKKHFVGVVFYWDNFVERLSCHRDKWSFPTRKGFDNFCLKIKLCIWIISIYSYISFEKATKFWEIFTLLLTTVHTVKMKISQNSVAFSEYMNQIKSNLVKAPNVELLKSNKNSLFV